MSKRNGLRACLVLAATLLPCDVASLAAGPDFDTAIAPLLAKRCAGCHNASDPKGGLDLTSPESARKGGETGAALVPNSLEKSLLWQRVVADEMPPDAASKLADQERRDLKQWIEHGAAWGEKKVNPLEYSSESRGGFDWWSLQPVRHSELPTASADQSTMVSPIDVWIDKTLRAKGLTRSAEASGVATVRRLSLDLLGLPPESDDVAEFSSSDLPDRFERLVDRTIASPYYGERWARHWLDVIRFGESQGFERDKLRTNSWRYRDWLIDAFNRDLPYDEFTQLQLAGDVLRPSDPDGLIATGFLVAGAYDEVGHTQQSAAMRAIVRQDELEDMVAAVAQTFLGLTVNCGRCHDHKFDPISQTEYYQLAAAIAGVRHGERDLDPQRRQAESRHAIESLQHRSRTLSAELGAMEERATAAILADRKAAQATKGSDKSPAKEVAPPAPLLSWEFERDAGDASGKYPGQLFGSASVAGGKLVVDGKGYAGAAPITFDLREKTLEAWVQLSTLDQRGGGVIGVQTMTGDVFDSIVFGEGEPGHWMAGSNGFVRTKSFGGAREVDAKNEPVHLAVTYRADGTIAAFRNGVPYGQAYQVPELPTYKAHQSHVIFGLRHSPENSDRLLRGGVLRARVYDRALSAAEVAASFEAARLHVEPSDVANKLSPAERQRRDSLQAEIKQLVSQIERWNESKIYAVTPRDPEPTFVLQRGRTTQPGFLVSAGGLRSLHFASADWGLPPDAAESQRRVRLAEWLSDRNNPLFSRVIANRLWHYHFGTGIVETTNDLGFNGTRPSHPELLDWLATSLWRHDGSLKSLHRTMVLSATYRQSSHFREDAAAIDAGNRLLWRREPVRLEAELIRDAMLAAAGDLNRTMHGPGYYDFTTFTHNSQFYQMQDSIGATFDRRGVYRTWVRSGRNHFLDVFDCPDPSTKTPVRAVTTTPLQSLALMNNSFAFRISENLAAKLTVQDPGDVASQVAAGVQRIYNRPASREELELLTAFARQHGVAALCRVLFNSNEFLYSP
ncbi:MAG: hypothetical protein RIS70_2424 [Planctomycetota bacterium]